MKNKKKYLAIIGVLVLLIITFIVLLILKNVSKNKSTKTGFQQSSDNSVYYLSKNGTPSFIKDYNYSITNKDELSDLLKDISGMYHFSDKPENEFNLVSEEEYNGYKHYKLQQVYNSIPVFGNQLIITTKDNKVTSISGHYEPNIKLTTYRSLTDADIKNVLKPKYGDDVEFESPEKSIYILDGKPYYTYKVNVDYNTVFIDLNSKKIIKVISNMQGEKESYTYKEDDLSFDMAKEDGILGTSYYFENLNYGYRIIDARNLETNVGTEEHKDVINTLKYALYMGDNISTVKLSMKDDRLTYKDEDILNDGKKLMSNLQKTFSYYKSLGRDSVDNKGLKVKAYLGAVYTKGLFSTTEWVNAQWRGDFDAVIIGSNNGKSYGACLDVVAHELTHGVIQYTSGFTYDNESGALNESYADVMGTVIENDNFEISECNGTLRDMSDPAKFENPSVVGGEFYFPDDENTYNSTWQSKVMEDNTNLSDWKDYDHGGVHTNSSVPNYAAYLAYNGGAYKDKNEMGKIYYDSLMLLTSNSTFEDAALAIIESAESNGLGEDKVKIIRDAFVQTKMLESNPLKINGKVTDVNGNPLNEVEVNAAYKINPSVAFTTYTNDKGEYSFDELPPSEYIFTYDKGKYAIKEVEQDIREDKTLDDVKLDLVDSQTGNSEVILIMDISASMTESDPRDIRKQMISNIVSELDTNSKIGLVTFAKTANINSDGINSNIDNRNIVSDIFNITNDDGNNDNSGTDGKAGLTKALNMFGDSSNRKYIVFFTDGQDNRENADDLSYDDIVKKAKEKNIRIISIGLGNDLNTTNLTAIASGTNGKYFNATTFSQLNQYTKNVYDEIK